MKGRLEEHKEVVEWKHYVGVKTDDEKMQKYLRYLNAIGFYVFTKPLKKIKSDFQYLCKKLKGIGKKVVIFSSRETISWELKLEASEVFYLEDLIDVIKRQ